MSDRWDTKRIEKMFDQIKEDYDERIGELEKNQEWWKNRLAEISDKTESEIAELKTTITDLGKFLGFKEYTQISGLGNIKTTIEAYNGKADINELKEQMDIDRERSNTNSIKNKFKIQDIESVLNDLLAVKEYNLKNKLTIEQQICQIRALKERLGGEKESGIDHSNKSVRNKMQGSRPANSKPPKLNPIICDNECREYNFCSYEDLREEGTPCMKTEKHCKTCGMELFDNGEYLYCLHCDKKEEQDSEPSKPNKELFWKRATEAIRDMKKNDKCAICGDDLPHDFPCEIVKEEQDSEPEVYFVDPYGDYKINGEMWKVVKREDLQRLFNLVPTNIMYLPDYEFRLHFAEEYQLD